MALLDFPNPVAWFEAAATGKLERDVVKIALSSLYSSQITFMWSEGNKKLWGFGQGLRDTATSLYLSLQPMVEKGDLDLTVPTEMLNADNLSRFQTISSTKL